MSTSKLIIRYQMMPIDRDKRLAFQILAHCWDQHVIYFRYSLTVKMIWVSWHLKILISYWMNHLNLLTRNQEPTSWDIHQDLCIEMLATWFKFGLKLGRYIQGLLTVVIIVIRFCKLDSETWFLESWALTYWYCWLLVYHLVTMLATVLCLLMNGCTRGLKFKPRTNVSIQVSFSIEVGEMSSN